MRVRFTLSSQVRCVAAQSRDHIRFSARGDLRAERRLAGQPSQDRRSRRARQIERRPVRTTVRDEGKQTVLDRRRVGHEAQYGDRAPIEALSWFAVRKLGPFHADTALRRGDPRQLDETSETDRGLAITGIGLCEAAIKVAMERRNIRTGETDPPGLPVVRVGRQNGVTQGVQPDVPGCSIVDGAPRLQGFFRRSRACE